MRIQWIHHLSILIVLCEKLLSSSKAGWQTTNADFEPFKIWAIIPGTMLQLYRRHENKFLQRRTNLSVKFLPFRANSFFVHFLSFIHFSFVHSKVRSQKLLRVFVRQHEHHVFAQLAPTNQNRCYNNVIIW